ncbi:putative Nonspecific lipid-transfer protein precursor [Tripterygium wilfordii]|uniref:Putative Nonspecific lipid-transfer protein n=1 Tax=Tripterygium wilfordii TaxID=458696 RepID=A0A7J7D6D0_TRIWF|nr:putative Nonspecific lipid-transfer protein precursor [Tripterygium wilfordii]
MGSRLIDTSLALVLVALLCGGAAAQSGCTSAITSLAPCLNYITANSSTPSSSCCTQLGNVIQSSPQCLCALLSGTGFNLGITINQTLALSLPGACNVQTPPMSQCNGNPTLLCRILAIVAESSVVFVLSSEDLHRTLLSSV